MTLTYIYVFALVLGGVLLLASIMMGGEDGGDADADADLDVDADVDADLDQGHQGIDADLAGTHGTLAGFATAFLSLRFWTFFAAFFGLTGLVMDGLDLVPGHVIPLGLASAMGLTTGYGAVMVLRYFASAETGVAAGVGDYVGKSARVLLPIEKGGTGKVRVELKGTTVDLLATTDEASAFGTGEEALIVSMQETTAIVARMTSDRARV